MKFIEQLMKEFIRAKRSHPELSHQKLKEILEYNKITGDFTWIQNRGGAVKGSIAGRLQRNGYTSIEISGRRYGAHRLAWFYVYSRWPDEYIDHINRIRNDNRWCNLRSATPSQNCAWRRQDTNKHGYKGVSANNDKYSARIRHLGVRYHLGTYKTPEEAHIVYCKKADKLFGEFASHDKLKLREAKRIFALR